MDCGWVKQHVERVLDGEYSPEVGERLSEHLRECPDCARVVRAAEEEERVLQAASSWPELPRDLTPAVMAGLPARMPRPPTRMQRAFRIVLPVVGVAAAVVMVCTLRFPRGREGAGVRSDAALHHAPGPPSVGAVRRPPASPVATVRVSSGTVEALPARGDSRPVEAGVVLGTGAVLRTATDSSVELGFGGAARVKLGSDSEARVMSSAVALVAGRLFVWVEEKGTRFSVTTPQAEAEVRGTEFCVAASTEGRTVLTVVEGVVFFSNEHGAVEVVAGLQSQAEAGSGPTAARPVDVLAVTAWVEGGGRASRGGHGVTLRARPDQRGGRWASGAPALVVELDYPDSVCVPLQVECEVTDADGRAVTQRSVQVSTSSYRYRVRKLRFPALRPGRYRAALRTTGRAEGSSETLEFEVE